MRLLFEKLGWVFTDSTPMVHGWYTDGTRMVHGRYADGTRMGRGWDADGTRMGRGWDADSEKETLSCKAKVPWSSILTMVTPVVALAQLGQGDCKGMEAAKACFQKP